MTRRSSSFDTPTKRKRDWSVFDTPPGDGVRKARSQEDAVATAVGGRRQPGSGAFPGLKGDVKSDTFLIECKRTDKASLGIKAEWLAKIIREAVEAGRVPALHFVIAGGDEVQEWVAVPMVLFKQLVIDKD